MANEFFMTSLRKYIQLYRKHVYILGIYGLCLKYTKSIISIALTFSLFFFFEFLNYALIFFIVESSAIFPLSGPEGNIIWLKAIFSYLPSLDDGQVYCKLYRRARYFVYTV